MSTLHLLLKRQRLFSVNIEDETSPIHAWSTGQLQVKNVVLGVLMNKNAPFVNLVFLRTCQQDHKQHGCEGKHSWQLVELATDYPS